MSTLFGIAIIAFAVVITTWSVEPTVGKTPTVSIDPLVLTTVFTAAWVGVVASYLAIGVG